MMCSIYRPIQFSNELRIYKSKQFILSNYLVKILIHSCLSLITQYVYTLILYLFGFAFYFLYGKRKLNNKRKGDFYEPQLFYDQSGGTIFERVRNDFAPLG